MYARISQLFNYDSEGAADFVAVQLHIRKFVLIEEMAHEDAIGDALE
jgi:hypothetical protein